MPKFILFILPLLCFQSMAQQKKPEIHGHRGFRGLYPENTITSFKEAARLGVDYIELDVVISGDSQVVVSHEPWFNPAFCSDPQENPVKRGKQRNLYEMSYEKIRKYDCGKRGHKAFPQQKKMAEYKPLLSEVIDSIEKFTSRNRLKAVSYNIEIKSHKLGDGKYHPSPERVAKLVHDILRKYQIDDRIMVQSFDPRCLAEIHKLDPGLRIGLLIMNRRSVDQNIKKLGFTPYAYNPSEKLCKKALIDKAHKHNCKVMVWTVNNEKNMQKLMNKGVDGIITDYPDVALKLR